MFPYPQSKNGGAAAGAYRSELNEREKELEEFLEASRFRRGERESADRGTVRGRSPRFLVSTVVSTTSKQRSKSFWAREDANIFKE